MGRKGLFCIASPLQAICAYEAMFEYDITEKSVIVIDDGQRLSQIDSFLSSKSIPYTICKFKKSAWARFLIFFKSLFSIRGSFDYLFLGNYLSFSMKLQFLPQLKCRGTIVYIDDGTSTITIANEKIQYSLPMFLRSRWCNIIIRVRSISDNHFFTFFSDDINRADWDVKKNNLHHTINTLFTDNLCNKYVLFVGTATKIYCDYLGVELNEFLPRLEALLKDILTFCNNIIFIPHGRDNCHEISEMCSRLGVIYKKIDECVELFVVGNGRPERIYGFSSTALKTLHIMFPCVPIYNVVIKDGRNKNGMEEYLNLADVYDKNGITKMFL